MNNNVPYLVKKLLNEHAKVTRIVRAIGERGGTALLVGGAVRDLLLGLPIKDLDIEVHGLNIDLLEAVLKNFGPVSVVGKSYGVLRVHGLDIDWSLPRIDASGRKPVVTIDPHMNFAQAFRRRDLTINAMGIDLITFELIDPFNGQEDLRNKVLRAPDATLFVEDPLRFYRVMQFIARFEMYPDDALNTLCATMDISAISRERIEVEFEKMFLKSNRPSLGIRWLEHINRLAQVLPEVAALKGVPQDVHWHPEGDVFEHTMQAVDAAAALQYNSDKEKIMCVYAALCHDLGKAITTQEENGTFRALDHAQEGVPLAQSLLRRITHNNDLVGAVIKLVQYHLLPVQFVTDGAKPPAYKRLSRKLAPDVTVQMLALVALADKRGRNSNAHTPLTVQVAEIDLFLERAAQCHVLTKPEEPILLGRDVIDVVSPGPAMGALLKIAYEIQIEQGICDKEELKKMALKKL